MSDTSCSGEAVVDLTTEATEARKSRRIAALQQVESSSSSSDEISPVRQKPSRTRPMHVESFSSEEDSNDKQHRPAKQQKQRKSQMSKTPINKKQKRSSSRSVSKGKRLSTHLPSGTVTPAAGNILPETTPAVPDVTTSEKLKIYLKAQQNSDVAQNVCPIELRLAMHSKRSPPTITKQWFPGERKQNTVLDGCDFFSKFKDVVAALASLIPNDLEFKNADQYDNSLIFVRERRPDDMTKFPHGKNDSLWEIACTDDWRTALAECAFHVWEDQVLERIILDLCVCVSKKKKEQPTNSSSEANGNSRKQSAQEQRETLVLNGKFNLIIELKGPVFSRELTSKETITSFNVWNVSRGKLPSIGFVHQQVKLMASTQKCYKRDDGTSLIGENSAILVHTGGVKATTSDPLTRSCQLRDHLQKCLQNKKRWGMKSGVLELRLPVGVGVMKSDDMLYESVPFDEDATEDDNHVEFSQDPANFSSPAQKVASTSKRSMRAAVANTQSQAAAFLKKIVTQEGSPCYNAFHRRQYLFLCDRLKSEKFDNLYCYDKWTLQNGDSWASWPDLATMAGLLSMTMVAEGEPGVGKYQWQGSLPVSVGSSNNASFESQFLSVLSNIGTARSPGQVTQTGHGSAMNVGFTRTFRFMKGRQSIDLSLKLSSELTLEDLYVHADLRPLLHWSATEITELKEGTRAINFSFPGGDGTPPFICVDRNRFKSFNLLEILTDTIPEENQKPVLVELISVQKEVQTGTFFMP